MAGVINGTVVDINGNAVQGATVYAIQTDVTPAEVVGQDTTDVSGEYSINFIEGGEVHVAAEWDGGSGTFNSRSRPFVTVESGTPDSVVHYYDPTQETEGETSTWTDQVGSQNLSGSYEVISGGINGENTARFDGVADSLSNTNINVSTLPFATVFVSQYQGDPNADDVFYFNTDTDLSFSFRDRSDGDYQAFTGGGTDTNPRGGTPDSNPHIFVVEALAGGGVRAEVDGTEIFSVAGNAGVVDGLTVGTRSGSLFAQFDLGDFYITEDHSASDLTALKNSLSTKWGITLV